MACDVQRCVRPQQETRQQYSRRAVATCRHHPARCERRRHAVQRFEKKNKISSADSAGEPTAQEQRAHDDLRAELEEVGGLLGTPLDSESADDDVIFCGMSCNCAECQANAPLTVGDDDDNNDDYDNAHAASTCAITAGNQQGPRIPIPGAKAGQQRRETTGNGPVRRRPAAARVQRAARVPRSAPRPLADDEDAIWVPINVVVRASGKKPKEAYLTHSPHGKQKYLAGISSARCATYHEKVLALAEAIQQANTVFTKTAAREFLRASI